MLGLSGNGKLTMVRSVLLAINGDYQLRTFSAQTENPDFAEIFRVQTRSSSGPEPVAKYQFLCRYPFTIGEKTYLEEGVTEEQHRQAIRDLVGAHPIVCSKHLLEIMFNEPQLLVVFRVALEIEMVYSIPGEDDDPPVNYHRLTVDDIIETQPGFPLSPDDPANYGADDEVLYGEPMTIEEYDRAFQTHQGPPPVHQSTALGVQPQGVLPSLPPVWEETNEMSEDELTYEVYVHPTPPPVNGTVGHPIGQNRRVSALPPPTLIIITDNDNESYTGSSDGINENENIITLSPTSPLAPIIPDATNNRANVGNGGTPAESYMVTPPPAADVEAIATDISNTRINEPCLDLSLGVGSASDIAPVDSVNDVDSSSDAEDVSGVLGPDF
uniref:Uncharacterized protein n=1 Tax=Brassica campestris TaxID=3711 RepID=M4ENB8_BRACM